MPDLQRGGPRAPYDISRGSPRYAVDIAVDCSTRQVFISNYVSNISKGGLFIQSETPLPMDAEVELILQLPDLGRSIRVKGRVVWNFDIRKGTTRIIPGSGIKFVEMAKEDQALLEEYLDRLGVIAPPDH